MPGARTHDFLTIVSAAAADCLYFSQSPHPSIQTAALFTASYVFAGFACAGDLDINSREYYRWGPFRCIWWPYRVLVPHRSWVSHGLVWGGLIRILYLATVTTAVFWTALWGVSRLGVHFNPNKTVHSEWQFFFAFVHAHPTWSAALLAGFVLAGTTHSLADLFFSSVKRHL